VIRAGLLITTAVAATALALGAAPGAARATALDPAPGAAGSTAPAAFDDGLDDGVPAGGWRTAAAGVAVPPELARVETFAFAIGGRGLAGNVARRFRRYDLVVADGEESSAAKVAVLRERGKVVLGYLSVGTIERWRSWYRDARRYRLEREPDWSGEWYAEVAAGGFRELIAGEVAPSILAKGFDGLFLDNTDMIETHGAQRRGMHELVARLGGLVHGGGYLFAQNGDRSVGPMLDDLDGWNREDVTSTYDFDRDRYRPVPRGKRRAARRALREIGARGLLTTTADYTRRGRGRWVRRSVRSACRVGAVPFVSNIELSRVPRHPPRC
jgi:hypothetical protein